MTNEMISFLMANGLSKQQATSSTAKICTQIFMKDDAKALIKEAQLQVEEARATVLEMRDKFKECSDEMKTFQAVLEAQKEYGEIEDPKAKTAIALYCALLSVGAKFGASADRNTRAYDGMRGLYTYAVHPFWIVNQLAQSLGEGIQIVGNQKTILIIGDDGGCSGSFHHNGGRLQRCRFFDDQAVRVVKRGE